MDDIYARIFEYASTGLLVLEKTTGRVLQANPAFLRMSGLACGEVVGRVFWEPPLIADAGAGREAHNRLLAGHPIEFLELPLKAGDGNWRLIEVSGHPTGDVVLLEVQDSTAREHARISERMATLRALSNRTAAEFRSLHNTLFKMGELLLANANQDRPVLRALEEVQQAGERAGAIAGQLAAFGGCGHWEPRRMSLNDLLKAMLPRLRQLFSRGTEIVYDLAPDLEQVLADPAQVRQIILMLATNSHEALGSGGAFGIQTRNSPLPAPAGSYVLLAVTDNGPGFDDQSWEHVFEPFLGTHADGRHLGLGLAAVYGMVQQNGGRIWAFSQPDRGALFRIYLPQASAQFPALSPSEHQPGSQATILLVEDNDTLRSVMANLLKRRGYRVLAALHPREAARIVEAQGLPDLLISRPLPELVRELRAAQPQLRVLFLAGYSDEQVDVLSRGTSVLRNPFEPDTLLAAIQELLDS